MRVINQSGLSIGWCVSRVPPHKLTATCIVKGTYSLKPGELAQPLPEQPPLNADVHEGDDIEKMLLVAGDFSHFKPACDVLLTGTCYARGGKAAPLERVTFGVGRWEKSLMVVGDRAWKPGMLGAKMTDPAPFISMPLGYDHAYGGTGFTPNPFGRGFVPVEKDLVAGKHPLPNIENPNQQISAPSSRPAPASFGPIPAIWLARAGKGGTYDKKWLKQNWPFFPDNFDWSFFNYAPADQQLKEFPKGDEQLRMRQMHPTVASYEAKLPGVRPRYFLREQIGNKLEFREAILQLDTIYVDMNKEQLTLVWRGVAPIASKRMVEVRDLLVVTEPLSKPPANPETYHAILRAEPAPKTPEKPGPRTVERTPATPSAAAPRQFRLQTQAVAGAKDPKLTPKMQEALKFLASALEALPTPDAGEIWTRERVLAAKPGELAGMDLAYLDLSGVKLANANLVGTIFTFANLAKADLGGADMGAAILADANLAGANLAGAKLANADLVHSNLTASNLSGANLAGADLSLAEAKGANFEKATGPGAIFISANLEGAKFKGAQMADANFSESRLPKADFEGANLQGAAFELCDASDAVFTNANCKLLKAGRGANLSRAKFIGAKAPKAAFHESKLDGADFKDADLTHAFFDGASLAGVNLAGVTAPGVRFDHTTLKGATLTRAHMLKASFENANLADADFRGANLFEAEFLDATGGTAQHFEGANIKRTKLA
jgi:uncharacterized protein YjbI with pentapeptide repeats